MKASANKSITVSFKASLGMLDQRMLMVFTSDTDCLPEGTSVPYSLVLVKQGAANKISVLVVSETSLNIQLDKDTYFRNKVIIKSIHHYR